MKRSNNIQTALVCVMMAAMILVGANEKNSGHSKPLTGVAGRPQVKKTNAGSVCVQLMTGPATTGDLNSDFCNMRVTIKTSHPVKPSLMSYINFGMRKSLFAVRGRDTFPCTVCERIPGIIPNEFIYLAGFDQLDPASGIFRLCISDTLLGFGELSMEIKNEIPQTPD